MFRAAGMEGKQNNFPNLWVYLICFDFVLLQP